MLSLVLAMAVLLANVAMLSAHRPNRLSEAEQQRHQKKRAVHADGVAHRSECERCEPDGQPAADDGVAAGAGIMLAPSNQL